MPSQAASHTICQAVSHMDLLIKEGEREKEREGRGREKRAFNTPPCFAVYFLLSFLAAVKLKAPRTRSCNSRLIHSFMPPCSSGQMMARFVGGGGNVSLFPWQRVQFEGATQLQRRRGPSASPLPPRGKLLISIASFRTSFILQRFASRWLNLWDSQKYSQKFQE